ncbi:AAA family ATPase [Sulfitobacter sp. CS16]|uniref:AAA family ATPase n=1 Tax=Sulfitobacter sp. CS16 TaxID=3368573 RepID=UPI0037455C7A
MGKIVPEVQSGHLTTHPNEALWLRTFQSAFDVTWASARRAHGSNYSVYFLKPTDATIETFGFEQEILTVYSKYDNLEARTFQSIEQFTGDDPARGRVDRLFSILISEAENAAEWVDEYVMTNEARTIVVFSAKELQENAGDAWYVRKKIASKVFARDLFDFRLPLEKDIYFFGRSALLHSFKDSVKRGENRGLFGLRKTGKTSFLYKLQRELSEDGKTTTLFYDCKNPSLRLRSASELLAKVISDISKALGVSIIMPSDDRFLSETLSELISSIPSGKNVLLIFDEVEYISYFSQKDPHWQRDYLTFWQSVWAAQSQTRNLSVVISGVNPRLVEEDKIEGIQNPLFGIVPYNYLKGLDEVDLRKMLLTLGRRMGVKFQPNTASIFMSEYGGHPLLCRLAASSTYQMAIGESQNLPVSINAAALERQKSERDEGLVFYCGHVVSELRDFYPDEYQVFELLACGHIADYLEFSTLPELRTHLQSYGLVTAKEGVPIVSIPVVGTHVALERARKEGRKTIQKLIAYGERSSWLKKRLKDINQAFSDLRRSAKLADANPLFGANTFPDSHKFMTITVVNDRDSLQSFLSTLNLCLVESIEIYGKSIGNEGYFWNEIRSSYPRLHQSLHRIKVYRHEKFHLELNDTVEAAYRKFIEQDLEGRDPSSVDELEFTIQQAVLDSLWNNLQIELSRYDH